MATYRFIWAVYYFMSLGYAKDVLYWPLLGLIGLFEVPFFPMFYYTMHTDTKYWREVGVLRAIARCGVASVPHVDTACTGLLGAAAQEAQCRAGQARNRPSQRHHR